MPNQTTVTLVNGVPTAPSGTVSTLDALMADGGQVTIGAKADAKSTATDTTAITAMAVWKQISASVQSLVTNIGTLTFTATRLLVRGEPRMFSVAGTVLTRPANQTVVVANGSVSDNETAGSVSALPVTVSDTNDDPITLERVRVISTDTAAVGKNFRLYIYNSDPTASSGVQAGNHVAFSNKPAGFVGTMLGLGRTIFGGSTIVFTPEEGSRITTLPGSGAKTIWYQLQCIDGYTPSANSTTFTPTFEGFQGRA